MDISAMFHMSYGLYILGAHEGDKLAGCLVNTVFQLTSDPVKVGVSVSKNNVTHGAIHRSGTVGISILTQESSPLLAGVFGYRTSSEINKFEEAEVPYHLDAHGDPLVDEGAIALLSAKVVEEVDVGSHTLFICEVTDAVDRKSGTPMTYKYFREVRKGKASKFAPTYVDPDKE